MLKILLSNSYNSTALYNSSIGSVVVGLTDATRDFEQISRTLGFPSSTDFMCIHAL